MRRVVHLCVAAALLAALSGCGNREDVAMRYAIEQQLWQAQLLERKININFVRADEHDLQQAIAAFVQLSNVDPFAGRSTAGWDPKVKDDIERLLTVSKIALANLYFLGERYYDAGDEFERTLEDPALGYRSSLDARLNLARSMYLAGEEGALEQHCKRLFDDISNSDLFWRGGIDLKEVFINVPLVLVRLYRERDDDASYQAMSTRARAFYDRIRRTWPDEPIAARASFASIHLHLLREEWDDGLREIRVLQSNPHFQEQAPTLKVLEGEILAYAKDDTRAGMRVFEDVVAQYPDTPAAGTAAYNIGVLELKGPDPERGEELLEDLEDRDGVAREIAAKSMLARALYLEKTERWDEALLVLRRIVRMHPHTSSAIEAPLVETRHYLRIGEKQLAQRSLERGRDFYLSLMQRRSKYAGDRLRVEDFLIENYMMLGQADEVARLLERESTNWDEVASAGGMFKSALIYANVLEDTDSARRILKKCIELFPETRYAKIAQRQLEQLEGRS